MPTLEIVRTVAVERTPRVMQLEGMFDLPPNRDSTLTWSAHLPLEDPAHGDWRIGLIVGPSGSGKSTLARELFGAKALVQFDWPRDRSVLDGFPTGLGVRETTALLSSVGFSSPPAWLRPFHVLSTGEQFRVTLARALAMGEGTIVIDEFTSVVDRTVARIGSAAVAKAIRRIAAERYVVGRAPQKDGHGTEEPFRFVAVSCHEDIIDWLDPDWTYWPASDAFDWRWERRRRPPIALEITRVDRKAWKLFKHHHYLSGELHSAARCFAGLVEGKPAAFTAVLPFPHPKRPGWREHRTVCLPDFQGVGIGNAMSEFVASVFVVSGKPYGSVTSHPAMIRHRLRSPMWKLTGAPHVGRRQGMPGWKGTGRMTAGFRYVGPAHDRQESLALLRSFR